MSTAILIAGKPGSSKQELDVPSDAISIDGNAPEAGDELEITLKVKVTGTEGKSTIVQPLECNGQSMVSEDSEPEKEESDPDQAMRDAAEKADEDESGMGY